jgi:hypothetical protein
VTNKTTVTKEQQQFSLMPAKTVVPTTREIKPKRKHKVKRKHRNFGWILMKKIFFF